MLDRSPVGGFSLPAFQKHVESKKEDDESKRRKDVSSMIRNALASGDIALQDAGKSPVSGLLNYEPRYQKLIQPGAAQTVPNWPSNPNAGGQTLEGESTGNPDRDWIISRESEFNPSAQNPNSSAFGLGQLIRANREAYAKRFGFDPDTTNPQEQLQMMDAYVKERYGDYASARKFWEQHHWY